MPAETPSGSHLTASAVEIQVGGRGVWALVDTGADFSMMREGLHDTLGRELTPPTQSAKGAGGEPLHIAGTIHKVPISIQGKEFLCDNIAVVRSLVYDFVLGRDFCCRFGTVIDDREGTLRIGGLTVPLPLYSDIWPHRSRVLLAANVTIPPRSTMLVGAKVTPVGGKSRGLIAIQGVLEPSATSGVADVLVPREIVTSDSSGLVPLQLTNTAYEEARLLRGTDCGTFYPFFPSGESEFQLCPDQASRTVASAVADGGEPRDSADSEFANPIIPDLDDTALSIGGKERVREIVSAYKDIFSRHDGDIGHTHLVEHTIDTGDAAPIRQPPRRIPVSVRAEIEEQKERMLRDGIIEPSMSAWSSPVVLARKKDGTFRFCVDLRAVNGVTKGHAHPLPRIDSTLDCLAGARFYSTLDLASGYWQVGIAESDREKTAFSTGTGLHQFRVMAMGLKNASATFQRLMELVLSGLDTQTCLVYLDDLVIFSQTEGEHLKTLEAVFERIRAAGLKLKPKKCHIAKKEVTFLGHLVTEEGIRPDPKNVEKVLSWPKPETAEEMAGFLGLCGYYAKFIANYTGVCKPLRDAAQRPGQLQWCDEMREAFKHLRRVLASPPVLALPTFRGTFILYTDACNSSVGSVLSELVNGTERVIAYDSKILTKSQVKWPTYDKELWAVVHAIRRFRQYTVGSKFVIVTDHKPLANIPGSIAVERDGTGRRGRWAVELSSFEFEVRVRAGSAHGNADALSRRPPGEGTYDEEPTVVASVLRQGSVCAAARTTEVQRSGHVFSRASALVRCLFAAVVSLTSGVFAGWYPPATSEKLVADPLREEVASRGLGPAEGGVPSPGSCRGSDSVWGGVPPPGMCQESGSVRGLTGANTGAGSSGRPSATESDPVTVGSPTRGGTVPCVTIPVTVAGAVTDCSPVTATDRAGMQQAQRNDPSLAAIGNRIRDGLTLDPQANGEWSGILKHHGRKMTIVEGIVGIADAGKFRVAVPEELRVGILGMAHNSPSSGHLGRKRTAHRLQERFIWPGMRRDVRAFCESCVPCQRRSVPGPSMKASLETETPSEPFDRVGIDITEMPTSSRGNRYALVIMDYFSKYVRVYPLKDQVTETVLDALMDWVYAFGAPKRLHSDQGRQFESHLFQAMCEKMGIRKTRTTPYHPQSDGMVERFNRTLKDMISKYIRADGVDWDQKVQPCTFAYNSSVHAATGHTPFFLLHGFEPRSPLDVAYERPTELIPANSYMENRLSALREAHDRARSNMAHAAAEAARRYDTTSRQANYRSGDLVWVRDFQASAGGKPKLGLKYKGPWTVLGQPDQNGGGVTYRVRSSDGKIRVLHHDALKPYRGPNPAVIQHTPGPKAGRTLTSEPSPARGGAPPPEGRSGVSDPLVEAWLGGAPGPSHHSPTGEVRCPGSVARGGGENSGVVYGPPTPRFTCYGRLSRPVVPFGL